MAFLIRAIFSFFYSIFNLFRFSILTLEDDARAECDHSLHFLEVSNWIQEHNSFEAIFQDPVVPKVNEIELLIYSTTILYKLVTKASHHW